MDRITLIEGYDPKLVRETLDLLLRDRKNEFRELAETMKIPTTSDDWEVIILKFCLDFEDCYKTWTDSHEPDSGTSRQTSSREPTTNGQSAGLERPRHTAH